MKYATISRRAITGNSRVSVAMYIRREPGENFSCNRMWVTSLGSEWKLVYSLHPTLPLRGDTTWRARRASFPRLCVLAPW